MYLRRNDSMCRSQFHQAIRNCEAPLHNTPATTWDLDYVANFSDFIKPYLADMAQTTTREGIANFQQFQFKARPDGNVEMRVRKRCYGNDPWRGLEGLEPHVVHPAHQFSFQ